MCVCVCGVCVCVHACMHVYVGVGVCMLLCMHVCFHYDSYSADSSVNMLVCCVSVCMNGHSFVSINNYVDVQ